MKLYNLFELYCTLVTLIYIVVICDRYIHLDLLLVCELLYNRLAHQTQAFMCQMLLIAFVLVLVCETFKLASSNYRSWIILTVSLMNGKNPLYLKDPPIC